MEIPRILKTNIRLVLLSHNNGIYLDNLGEEFFCLCNSELNYQRLGYKKLEDFLRAMPDAARLDYSARDKRIKVFGVAPAKKMGSGAVIDVDSLLGSGAVATGGVRNRFGSGGEPVFTPDRRGLYSLSFLAQNRPDIVGTLEDLFSVAGRVAEVEDFISNHSEWICVRYYDAKSAGRAYRMFQSLGMKPSSSAVSPPAQNASGSLWRGQRLERRNTPRPVSDSSEYRQQRYGQKRKPSLTQKGACYRVYVGNLDPDVNYTFTMFFELFRNYTVRWVTMKPSVVNDNPRLCAFVLLPNREQADRLAAEFDGFVWMGRRLVTEVKEKQKDGQKRARTFSSEAQDFDTSSLPELIDTADMPGLEPMVPKLESGIPALEHALPRLEPAMPSLEPDMPGLEPTPTCLQPLPGLPNFRVMRKVDSSSPHHETPTIIVTNFLDEVTQDELLDHFSSYGSRSINLLPTKQGRKKAYIVLGSVDDVKRAVAEMNQVPFRGGLRLKVDVPFNMPNLRQAVLGPEHALTVPPQAQSQAQSSTPPPGALTVSQILKVRGECLQILQTSDGTLNLGDQLRVQITTVISDRFFWGQIANMHHMERLQRISEHLNKPQGRREMATGPGRCTALFHGDGKWYRAWAIKSEADRDKVRVFYLDYGNTDVVPWTHTAKNSEQLIWDLQPMAMPFTLAEPVTNLKSRELTSLMVEVNACGSLEEGNMVVVRATSLLPELDLSVSGVGQTVME